MSDVSGIPYMGPMGMGNFFAPQFSYNPQMSAGQISSTYMPEIANNQNVVNNLFNTPGGGGGFGRATDYYSQLGANYLAAVPSSWANPYAHGAVVPQSLRVEGGNYADGGGGVFNQGAVNNFITGGGGFNFPSSGGGAPAINWDTIFQSAGGGLGGSPRLGLDDLQTWAGNWNAPQSSAFDFSGGMFGGLAGGMGGAYQGQNNQMDWTHLFSGGGAQTDPYPGMPMPGGLNSPMTVQQPAYDYGSLYGRGVGGGVSAGGQPYTSGIAPDETGGQTLDAPMAGAPSSMADWSTLFGDSGGADPFPGMAMPGGLNSPMTLQEPNASFADRFDALGGDTPQPQASVPGTPATGTRTYDLAPMFEGGGGGFGTGGADTSQLFGANAGSFGGNAFDYNPAELSGAQNIFPQSADAMAEQARARLAGLMGSGDTAPVAPPPTETEPPVAPEPAIPLPRERPAEAEAPRPPETVPPTPPAAPPVEPPAALPAGMSRPPGNVFPPAKLAPNGKEPEAFIVHHTSGRGTPESVVNSWRTERPGVGTQYIMDRNGIIHDTAAEYGHKSTGQALPSATGTIPGSQGLGNANIVGMEIIALNDKDVTPAQIASLKAFAEARYPDTPFYGHGEISTNKEPNEGRTGMNAILDARVAAGYPPPAPGATGTTPPPGFFDPSGAIPSGPTTPTPMTWQSSIPQAQRTPEVTSALQAQANRFGIPVESIPAVLSLESNWNPMAVSPNRQNFGVAQMARGDFQTAGGTLGGMTFEQYQRAPLAKQIAAYGDFIASSPKAAYLDYASGDPALTSAILQAIQFSPQKEGGDWSEALLAGNTGLPIARNQASELKSANIDDMRAAFARRIAGVR